jgi:MSHA pilin protein MshA
MKPVIKRSAQGGFTLIELIVVIVILGILAATALPKFADLGKDARIANLNAARGAMSATASMIHGKYLITTPSPTKVTVEGIDVPLATTVVSGYPAANDLFINAAGMTTDDYTIVQPNKAATTSSPLTSATQIAIIPKSVAGTPAGLSCYMMYTEPAAAGSAPTLSAPVTTSC